MHFPDSKDLHSVTTIRIMKYSQGKHFSCWTDRQIDIEGQILGPQSSQRYCYMYFHSLNEYKV